MGVGLLKGWVWVRVAIVVMAMVGAWGLGWGRAALWQANFGRRATFVQVWVGVEIGDRFGSSGLEFGLKVGVGLVVGQNASLFAVHGRFVARTGG